MTRAETYAKYNASDKGKARARRYDAKRNATPARRVQMYAADVRYRTRKLLEGAACER